MDGDGGAANADEINNQEPNPGGGQTNPKEVTKPKRLTREQIKKKFHEEYDEEKDRLSDIEYAEEVAKMKARKRYLPPGREERVTSSIILFFFHSLLLINQAHF